MYHHFSQILPKQHISNYSSNQSMGAKKILHLMRKSPPPPEHKESGTKKKKKNPLYEKSLPLPHKREKKVPQIDCFPGEPGTYSCSPPPLRAPMSKCDYKIHNIYSTLIYIKNSKYTLECTQLNYFLKEILGRAYPRIL